MDKLSFFASEREDENIKIAVKEENVKSALMLGWSNATWAKSGGWLK